jgi:hypothetical protein
MSNSICWTILLCTLVLCCTYDEVSRQSAMTKRSIYNDCLKSERCSVTLR